MKKGLLAISAVALLVLTACGNSEANIKKESNKKADQSMVVSTFGLSEDIVKKDIITPFEEEYSAKITLDLGNSSDRFTKLKNNKKANIDVIELSQANSTEGNTSDMFEKVSEKEVPNLAELTDGAKEVFENGGGIPIAVNSIGIIYDKEKIGKEITSWDDLWDSALKGKISVPDISTTAGPLMLYVASDHAKTDITSDKGEAAFSEMKNLKPNVTKTYTKSSDLANMFQAGEIEAAVVADFAVDIIKSSSDTLEYVVPKSGTYANYNTINVPKASANKELAYKFINYRISEESQKTKAISLNEGPINKKVTLSEEEQGNKTYGEVANRAKMVDFNFVNDNLSTWLDRWNKIMNQ
ncbi:MULTISPECIES: ABC transporter substrate-binding protein [Vagococcus]|uniref:ABC transporter substrate-binding protein n=1 Tax=Vagococcus TaxID=2737 RepID=UPI000E4FFEAB|nr:MULTISPECIES: ABC transporter substrate-binding protein [Vagococcus]RHH70148.1 ABC transporter substrate-binding protein [Vagococcus sp. AM17-17]